MAYDCLPVSKLRHATNFQYWFNDATNPGWLGTIVTSFRVVMRQAGRHGMMCAQLRRQDASRRTDFKLAWQYIQTTSEMHWLAV